MVGSIEVASNYSYSNGVVQSSNGSEEKLDELRRYLGKPDGDLLKIVGVGGGTWGSVFAALLQDSYGPYRDKVQIKIWRRPATAEHLFEVINSREDVLRRLISRCAYLKYVEARLGDRTLYADEILKDGFCLNMIDTPLCPLKVVTNLQEAVWDADIVINALPSTETRDVFEEIRDYWKERITTPVIISLVKGIEAELSPCPRKITPTQMISQASMVAALTKESAMGKSVYFAHCTSEMIFITHLLTEESEKLAGPLLADTYVTLLKGHNAWYGQMIAKGQLSLDMGDSIMGKGTIQGVSAIEAFYDLLRQPSLNVLHPDSNKQIAQVELCPILKILYKILITREQGAEAILQARSRSYSSSVERRKPQRSTRKDRDCTEACLLQAFTPWPRNSKIRVKRDCSISRYIHTDTGIIPQAQEEEDQDEEEQNEEASDELHEEESGTKELEESSVAKSRARRAGRPPERYGDFVCS